MKTVSSGLGQLGDLTIQYPTGVGVVIFGGDGWKVTEQPASSATSSGAPRRSRIRSTRAARQQEQPVPRTTRWAATAPTPTASTSSTTAPARATASPATRARRSTSTRARRRPGRSCIPAARRPAPPGPGTNTRRQGPDQRRSPPTSPPPALHAAGQLGQAPAPDVQELQADRHRRLRDVLMRRPHAHTARAPRARRLRARPGRHGRRRRSKTVNVKVRDDYYSPQGQDQEERQGQVGWGSTNIDSHNVTLKKGPKGVKKDDFRSIAGRDRHHVQAEVHGPGDVQLLLHDPPDGDEDGRRRQEVMTAACIRIGAHRWTGELDRRHFLAGAGGVFLCTLAGHRSSRRPAGRPAEARARRPGAAEGGRGRHGAPARTAARRRRGRRAPTRVLDPRRAGELEHRPHRARRDDERAGQGEDEVQGLRLPPYTPNFAEPLGPADGSPGPLIEAKRARPRRPLPEQGSTSPVTIHPHGIFYSSEMDGAYKGKYTDPGRVRPAGQDLHLRLGRRPGTDGRVALPRPRPDGPAAGLQGPVRAARSSARPDDARADREFFVAFHTFTPRGDRPQHAVLLHQRPRVRRQHADARGVRSASGSRCHVFGDRQRLPHLPHPRPPLDRRGRDRSSTTKTLGPGRLVHARVRRGQPGPLVLPLPRLQPSAHGDERVVPRRADRAARARRRDRAARGAAASRRAGRGPPTAGWRSATTSGRTRTSTSTSASTSPGTGSGPTRCTRSPATRRTTRRLDSDPGNDLPRPRVGDSFQLDFDQPGTYDVPLQAPLGRPRQVIVSSTPGDPSTEPDPVPQSNVDLRAPHLSGIRLDSSTVAGKKGTQLTMGLDERGTARPTSTASPVASTARIRRLAELEDIRGLQPCPVRRPLEALQPAAGDLRGEAPCNRRVEQHDASAAGPASPSADRTPPAAAAPVKSE